MKKDFIAITDYSAQEVQELLDLAIELKKEHFAYGNPPILRGKVLGNDLPKTKPSYTCQL